MRIICRYQDQKRTEDFAQAEVIVGRPDVASVPNLDLSPDPTVSRRHARIWVEQGVCWVEDLNSRFGTLVNGEKLLTRRALKRGDSIRIGETTLAVADSADDSGSGGARGLEATTVLPNVEIGPSLDARETAGLPAKFPDLDVSKRLSLLFELPLQFGAEVRVDGLLQIIIERVVDVIRGAKRGALLLRERHSERLLLKAYVSATEPAVFGSPESDPEQHENALRAAQLMQAEMKKLQAHRHAAGKVSCEIGIGIHCGEVLHGFIGASDRMEFRVVGDAVNRASRYCDGAQAGEIMISPELFQRVFKLVRAEKTQIATKHEGDLTAYRVKAVAA